MEISVCICTYKRPEMLRSLLWELQKIETGGVFTYSVVVVDNDVVGSAKKIVEEITADTSLGLEYYIQPSRNIAIARNMAVRKARGDLIAFIDDDEVPVREWLLHLYQTYKNFQADGVLGPVNPRFEVSPPDWIIKGRFCERPAYLTGTRMHWTQTRTGNVLLGRHLVEDQSPFDPLFAVGGEDVNFFKGKMEQGSVFVWCNEAPVYEIVPPVRCSKRYFIKRAFLQGNVSTRYQGTMDRFQDKISTWIKSLIAFILYTAILPFTAVAGVHVFMKYLIKDIHHISRLLAMSGMVRIRSRNI